MSEDISIKYQAKLIEVKDNLEQLKTLEIDPTVFETEVNRIDQSMKQEVAECYHNYHKSDSNIFLYDSLISVYNSKIKELDKINNHIVSEYEEYYKISADIRDINQKLEENAEEEISTILSRTLLLLQRIRNSTSIDYEQERNLVENTYQLVYQVMKLELVVLGNDTILNGVKNHEQDISYIMKLVKEESLKFQDSNEQIKRKVEEINRCGFQDIYYLDKDLILMLAMCADPNLLSLMEKNLFTRIDRYQEVSNEIKVCNFKNDMTEKNVLVLQQENKKIGFHRLGKKIALYINLGIVGALLAGSFKICKENSPKTVYKTVTTTYDSSKPDEGEVILSDVYEDSRSDSISLIEYSPWEEPGYFRDNYKRNIYTYDLNGLESSYDTLEEYLTSDLKDLITIIGNDIQYSTEMPDEDYFENKYVITRTKQDKSITDKVDRPEIFALYMLLFSSGIIGIDAFVWKLLSKVSLRSLKKEKRKNKEKIQSEKQLLLENHLHMDDLERELFTLKQETEKEYHDLPLLLQQDEKVKQKMYVIEAD